MTTDEPPAHLLPLQDSLNDLEEQCRFCPEKVRFGKTNKGSRAPFDLAHPHVNHWSTCAGRREARKAFKRGPRHPQNPRRGD